MLEFEKDMKMMIICAYDEVGFGVAAEGFAQQVRQLRVAVRNIRPPCGATTFCSSEF